MKTLYRYNLNPSLVIESSYSLECRYNDFLNSDRLIQNNQPCWFYDDYDLQ